MSKDQIVKKIMDIEKQLVLEQRHLAELQFVKHKNSNDYNDAQQRVNRLMFEEHHLQTELRKYNIEN